MDNLAIYQSKLTTAENAVSPISSGSIISIGMAMAEPPALLRALAERVEASELGDRPGIDSGPRKGLQNRSQARRAGNNSSK